MPHCYVVNPVTGKEEMEMCQCPLGLMPHCYDRGAVIARVEAETVSMPSRAVTSFLPWDRVTAERSKQHRVNALSGCYLISTGNCRCGFERHNESVNALSGCYLISTMEAVRGSRQQDPHVSMPSRAVTSFLQYPFKNLGFMRFLEPIFAGICQNILTATHFHAC